MTNHIPETWCKPEDGKNCPLLVRAIRGFEHEIDKARLELRLGVSISMS